MYYNSPSHTGSGWDYHWVRTLYNLGDKPLKYFHIPGNTGNWDSFVENGLYSTYGAANAPVANTWVGGIVIQLNNSYAYPMQLAFSKNHMYVRGNDNGTMSSWTIIK